MSTINSRWEKTDTKGVYHSYVYDQDSNCLAKLTVDERSDFKNPNRIVDVYIENMRESDFERYFDERLERIGKLRAELMSGAFDVDVTIKIDGEPVMNLSGGGDINQLDLGWADLDILSGSIFEKDVFREHVKKKLSSTV